MVGRINFLKSKQLALATIYMIEDKMAAVVFNTNMAPNLDYDFSAAIFKYFSSSCVIVLDVINQ